MVVEAQDRASHVIKRVGDNIKGAFGSNLKSAIVSLVSFSAILGAVGVSVSTLVTKLRDLFKELQESNRAAAKLQIQMTLTGFSTARATAEVDRLRNALNRTTFAALPGLDAGLRELFTSLGPDSQERIGELAESLQFLGAEPAEALNILGEAARGNYDPLNDFLGLTGKDRIQNWRDAEQAIEDFKTAVIENMTPLERLKFAFVQNLKDDMSTLVDFVNNVLAGNFKVALQQFVDSDLFHLVGRSMSVGIVIGMLEFLLGDTTTTLLRLAFTGQWAKLWQQLKEDVKGWATSLGTWFIDGLTNFILGLPFIGPFIQALLSIGKLVQDIKADASNWGGLIAEFIVNGLIGFLESQVNRVVGYIQSWINRVVGALNAVPGVNIQAPTIPGLSIPRASFVPEQPEVTRGGSSSFRGGPPIHNDVVVYVGNKQVDALVYDAMNRGIRARAPGLA